jgi:8-oxo-dGTP diphosphatase
VFDALGVRDPGLEPGAMLVVPHRKGRVVATELHSA